MSAPPPHTPCVLYYNCIWIVMLLYRDSDAVRLVYHLTANWWNPELCRSRLALWSAWNVKKYDVRASVNCDMLRHSWNVKVESTLYLLITPLMQGIKLGNNYVGSQKVDHKKVSTSICFGREGMWCNNIQSNTNSRLHMKQVHIPLYFLQKIVNLHGRIVAIFDEVFRSGCRYLGVTVVGRASFPNTFDLVETGINFGYHAHIVGFVVL